jgi:hypothetical protein
LLGFLDAVFPEHTLAGGKRGIDPVIRLSLADRHQGGATRSVSRAGCINLLPYSRQIAGNIGGCLRAHGCFILIESLSAMGNRGCWQ